MSLKGNVSTLARFSADLRRLPRVVAQRVATVAAPAITKLAASTFASSSDPYGAPWAPGAEGQRVTLYRTGALARFIRYVAIGTKLRVALGVPYAKYQIGKRPVYPTQGGELPLEYTRTLQRVAVDVVRQELGR